MAAVSKYESPPSYSISMGFPTSTSTSNNEVTREWCDKSDRSASHPRTRSESHKSHRHRRHSFATDTIDRLDHSFGIGFEYHHEGPFDCASRACNSGPMAPIDALARTNALALSAVPPAKIADAVNHNRPIDGVAVPGQSNVQYEAEDINVLDEFQNPMIAGRWPGEDFASAGANQRESNASPGRRISTSSVRTSASSSSGKRRSWGFSKKNETVEVVESLIK
ncbi:hypothetical protein V1520DRAFT_339047 [Lipomyces starkeyi]|uniref:Uncharacterized protein n=1 Tax=Lipomyces starkeyi NRRL Y-11557 TaxID=675824 RepID=A0A1E3Q033_LIPST|nr:hypothetical protein LIPSTDRAFT_113075 [Lipomyces starkeyi NRRL Y-11557]